MAAGFKTVILRWIGGNVGPPPPQPGWRSPVARWIGGLAGFPESVVVEPEPPVQAGGGLRLRPPPLKRITGVLVSGSGTESAGRGTYVPVRITGRLESGGGTESKGIGVYTPVRIVATIHSSVFSEYIAYGELDNSLPELIREEDELLLTLD